MEIDEIIKTRRSIRRYKQDPIEEEVLISLVDCARFAPSGGNLQPLEYIIVNDETQCLNLFKYLNWAAYIAPAGNPPERYRPTAYIVVLVNTDIKKERYEYDIGASVENILISAHAKGIGSCWIINFKVEDVLEALQTPENIIPNSVIALGYPAEESMIEPMEDSIKYYKDDEGKYHVPKRGLEQILHWNQYSKKD